MHWAEYQSNSNKAKLHLGFDLNHGIPRKLFLTEGNGAERPFVSNIIDPGQTAVLDRGYQAHALFDEWQQDGGFRMAADGGVRWRGQVLKNKCLSINNHDLVQDNHSGRQCVECNVREVRLLVSWYQFPKPVEPGMRQLNDPPSCFERRILFDQLFLFAPWSDVGNESVGYHGVLLAHICCIKAEILRSVLFFWCNHSVFQQNVKGDTIMPIGSADDE